MDKVQKNEYPLVHIYAQSGSRHPVRIVANTEGLLTLVTALIEATSTVGFGNAEVFDADAEAYEVVIERDDCDSAWSVLELPYSNCKQQ